MEKLQPKKIVVSFPARDMIINVLEQPMIRQVLKTDRILYIDQVSLDGRRVESYYQLATDHFEINHKGEVLIEH